MIPRHITLMTCALGLVLTGLIACTDQSREVTEGPGSTAASPTSEAPAEAAQQVAASQTLSALPNTLTGTWATSEEHCGNRNHERFTIRRDAIEFFEGGGELISIRSRDNEIRVVYQEPDPGSQAQVTQSVTLVPASADRLSLAYPGRNFVPYKRCKNVTASGVGMADTPLTIHPGVYVTSGNPCSSPSNAGLRIYNGTGLSGSATRDCQTRVVSANDTDNGTRFIVRNDCENTYDASRSTEELVMDVSSPTRFRIEDRTYSQCDISAVPGELRALVED